MNKTTYSIIDDMDETAQFDNEPDLLIVTAMTDETVFYRFETFDHRLIANLVMTRKRFNDLVEWDALIECMD